MADFQPNLINHEFIQSYALQKSACDRLKPTTNIQIAEIYGRKFTGFKQMNSQKKMKSS